MLARIGQARHAYRLTRLFGLEQGQRLARARRRRIGDNMNAKAKRRGETAEHSEAHARMDDPSAKWRWLGLSPVTHGLDLLERG